jgi:hypothetical protein
MSDKSAFHLTMANAAMFFGKEIGCTNAETAESMKYYTISLRSINKRLLDPIDSISEGVMGTVLGFVCHDVSLLVKPSYNVIEDFT